MNMHVIYDGTLGVWRGPGIQAFWWVLNRDNGDSVPLEEGDVLTIFGDDDRIMLEYIVRPARLTWWEPFEKQRNIPLWFTARVWHYLPLRAQLLFHPFMEGSSRSRELLVEWVQEGKMPEDWADLFIRPGRPPLSAQLLRPLIT